MLDLFLMLEVLFFVKVKRKEKREIDLKIQFGYLIGDLVDFISKNEVLNFRKYKIFFMILFFLNGSLDDVEILQCVFKFIWSFFKFF